MTNKQQVLLTILSYTFLISPIFTTGDPQTNVVKEICNSTFASDTPIWATYFVTAMDYLSTEVAQKGYGTTVVGNGTVTWHGLAQCYEDLDSVDCTLCYSELRGLMPKCYPYIGGKLYLDGCFARYENYTFFNEVLGTQDTSICNSTSFNNSNFSQAIKHVLTNVTSQAINKNGFAKGYGEKNNTTAYAMAQCWEVLNQSECATCLNAAKESLLNTCGSKTEGRAIFTGCFVRFSSELFWNVFDSSSNSKGKKEIIWIVLGCILGILLLVLPILVWKKRCFLKETGPKITAIKIPEEIAKSSLNFRYVELMKATNNFKLSNKLGQGSYGSVYKANLGNGNEVAVKRLFMNTTQFLDQFFNEVDLISKVRHKYLVKLLGFSVDGPESLLVYEYYHNRSLESFYFWYNHSESNKRKLDLQQRMEIIQGIAEGISYLHEESETRIIHRDIKASNILLDNNFKPKLTDFGLARIFSTDKTHLSTGIAGTLGYMAPEYVVHGHLTEKADVYSYGILLLEILTGQRCGTSVGAHVSHSLLSVIWESYKSNSLSNIIDQSLYHQNKKDDITNMVHIGLLCTQSDQGDRQAMSKVVKLLRSVDNVYQFTLNDPPYFRVDVREEEEGVAREVSVLLSKNSSIS